MDDERDVSGEVAEEFAEQEEALDADDVEWVWGGSGWQAVL